MQWCTEDGTEGLLELAMTRGHLHSLPLLLSMGVCFRAPFRTTPHRASSDITGQVIGCYRVLWLRIALHLLLQMLQQ
jgi:hypothetical protein